MSTAQCSQVPPPASTEQNTLRTSAGDNQKSQLCFASSSWINITPRDVADGKHAKEERDLLYDALTSNPQWLVGRHAHKFFPEWNGICRAHVLSYDAKNKLWLVEEALQQRSAASTEPGWQHADPQLDAWAGE
eukprot:COSAG01_NODE_2552_length_7463_cov_644.066947_1_plen_133_part_00